MKVLRVGKVGAGVMTKNKFHSASVTKMKGFKPAHSTNGGMGRHVDVNRKYAVGGVAAAGLYGAGQRGARSQNKHPQARGA